MTTVHPFGNGSGVSTPAALIPSTPQVSPTPPASRGKASCYPITPERLEADLACLVATGRHHDGKRAAVPKASYFLHFRILGLALPEAPVLNGQPPFSALVPSSPMAPPVPVFQAAMLIPERGSRLVMLCQCHQHYFVSTPRILLNTSEQLGATTCRFCGRQAGVGRAFQTIGELAHQMSAREDFDFLLDMDALPTKLRDPDVIVLSKERLALVCKRLKLGSSEPCGQKVTHSVNNILTALSGNVRHLACQGSCDSMNRGKAQRMTAHEVRERLLQARQDSWRLPEDSGYRKASAPALFEHVGCGQRVRRLAHQVLGYPQAYGLDPATDGDCPYCQPRMSLAALGGDASALDAWLQAVTGGHLMLGENQPFCASSDAMKVTCSRTGERFTSNARAILSNEHHGCPHCQAQSAAAQKAWVLGEACELVRRRGWALHGDPGSYTVAADLRQGDGMQCGLRALQDAPAQSAARAPWSTILELLRACPARPSALGIFEPGGVPAARKPAPPPASSGQPYSPQEDSLLRVMVAERCHSNAQIGASLGRTAGSIAQRMRQLGLRNDGRNTVIVNHAAFATVTPKAAYFAGVMASDGCISQRGDIQLELKAIDEPVLLALLAFMGCERPLRYRSVKNVDGRGVYASFSVRSAPIIAHLWQHYGIGPRKTYVLQPPGHLLRDEKIAFLSGLLEGDGCIRVSSRRQELVIHLACASRPMVDWYWQSVQELTGLKMPAPCLLKERKSSNWAVSVTGEKARVLGRVLLEFEGQMTRKWSVLKSYLGQA